MILLLVFHHLLQGLWELFFRMVNLVEVKVSNLVIGDVANIFCGEDGTEAVSHGTSTGPGCLFFSFFFLSFFV